MLLRESTQPSKKRKTHHEPSESETCQNPQSSSNAESQENPRAEIPTDSQPGTSKNSDYRRFSDFYGPELKCPTCQCTFRPPRFSRRRGFVADILSDDKKCFRWTGFPTVKQLETTFDWLLPAAERTTLWDSRRRGKISTRGKRRSPETLFYEYLLTLVRIRRGFDTDNTAYFFEISPQHVSKIFITWVNLLAKCLQPMIKWPSTEVVKGNLPRSFQHFPTTRVIIDATEFFIQKPFRPLAQRQTWSNYKHHNTFKLLVGIMPTGTITFLSKLYSGSISDLSIVQKSGLLKKLSRNNDVMADRGFKIRHLLLKRGCTLNIPAFSHGQNLSYKAVRNSRRIASVRIHVERAIGRMKTFRILNGIIPLKVRFCLNQILVIVSYLCNLQPRLCG